MHWALVVQKEGAVGRGGGRERGRMRNYQILSRAGAGAMFGECKKPESDSELTVPLVPWWKEPLLRA